MIYVGVLPDGASMKVFFMGRGCPLFVTPSVLEHPVSGNKAASESGGGRFRGMVMFVGRLCVTTGE